MEDFWLIVTPRRVKISQKSSAPPTRVPAEKLVRDIRRATRKHHSADGKIRIVSEGLVFD
jgi:transposase